MLPSTASPTSSPLSFNVHEPELPFVMSRSDSKSIGRSPPSIGSAYGPNFFALIASSNFAGELNGSLPVSFARICDATVNGPSASSFDSGFNDFTVPYVTRSVPFASGGNAPPSTSFIAATYIGITSMSSPARAPSPANRCWRASACNGGARR